jgi:hypothetical protein
VSEIIASRSGEVITFPEENHDVTETKNDFYQMARFPNVIGAVDGTLIRIQSPKSGNETSFVSRKGGHSLNIQVVCDANMRFTNVVVKWPGATHDSYIWKNSGLRAQFVETPPTGWLLGKKNFHEIDMFNT